MNPNVNVAKSAIELALAVRASVGACAAADILKSVFTTVPAAKDSILVSLLDSAAVSAAKAAEEMKESMLTDEERRWNVAIVTYAPQRKINVIKAIRGIADACDSYEELRDLRGAKDALEATSQRELILGPFNRWDAIAINTILLDAGAGVDIREVPAKDLPTHRIIYKPQISH